MSATLMFEIDDETEELWYYGCDLSIYKTPNDYLKALLKLHVALPGKE